MPHRSWADRVEDALARRGVPARYRRRLLAELRDHADDLTDRGNHSMTTDDLLTARLGDPAALAAQAAEEHRRARWASRHPALAFGLLPLPAVALAVVATGLVLGLAGFGVAALTAGDVDELPRPAALALAYPVAWGVRFVPFVLLAVLFTRLYLRSRVSPWWLAAAAAQVLVAAGSFSSAVQLGDGPGQSAWVVGFALWPVPRGDGWGLPVFNLVGWAQAAQVAIPVAVGALVLRAARRRAAALAAC